jgi:hypothetical protein
MKLTERAVDGVIVIGVEETFTVENEVDVATTLTVPLGTTGGAVYVAVTPFAV